MTGADTFDRRSVLRKTGAATVGALALGASAGSAAAEGCMELSGDVVSDGATVYNGTGGCDGDYSIGSVDAGEYGTITNHYCCGGTGPDGVVYVEWYAASPDGWVDSDDLTDV